MAGGERGGARAGAPAVPSCASNGRVPRPAAAAPLAPRRLACSSDKSYYYYYDARRATTYDAIAPLIRRSSFFTAAPSPTRIAA